MRTVKFKKSKSPEALEQERLTSVNYNDKVYIMKGREFRSIDKKKKIATPKDG